MTKRPKPRAVDKPKDLARKGFLEALKFCSLITKKEGSPNETSLMLNNKSCCSFNGVLACGISIDEDILAYPNAELITNAIAKCREHYSITQLDKNRLSIKSNKFKAIVSCLDPAMMQPVIPDPPQATLDNRFSEALASVSILASETAQSVVTASVLMAGASLIATDRKVIIEAYHACDLPVGIALPKAFCVALQKIDKKLTKFGYGRSSCTFYFDDESWLRTQFFSEPWPDVSRILNRKANMWPVPNEFWQAVDAVAPFSHDGDLHFDTGILRSSGVEDTGASHEVFGLPQGPIFSAKQLKLIQPYMQQVDFMAEGGCLVFQGGMVRGVIAGRAK